MTHDHAHDLDQLRAQLRTIVEEMPVLIDAFDLEGRVVLWNRECVRVTGYEVDEVMGRSDVLELLYPDPTYRAQMLAAWQAQGLECRDLEWTLTRKDGMQRTVAWSNIAGRVPIPGWASWAVGVDVTQRRAAQEVLRSSQERYKSLMSIMSHGVSEVDVAGRIVYGNPAYHRMHGYEPGELIGKSIYQLYVGPETAEQLAARLERLAREQPPPDFYCFQGRGRDGQLIDIECSWDYKHDEHGKVIGFVAVLADVTARKRAEEERQRIEERLRETQKLESLAVLAGGIAHDFNNLLMSILGNTELARHQSAAGSPALPFLEQIEKSSLRAAELCQQMLAYAGRGQLAVAPVDLVTLVTDTADLLRLTISKKVALRLDVSPGVPAVQADASQLRQVVLNLLLNAAEAIGDQLGRIVVRLGLEHLGRERLDKAMFGQELPAGNFLCLEVKDSGCGMTEDVRARIFEPFFTTKTAGRGLGLSAVVGIVRGHRGTLTVETAPEQGVTFRVYLPVSPVETVARVATARSEWTGHGTVLVADDDPRIRQVTQGLLQTMGFTVVAAVDGRDAVERFKQQPQQFRFALLDLTMPHLDGRQTLQELHRIRPDLLVILMSGYSERDAVESASITGHVEFLQKPFRMDELRARIRSLLQI